jgi:hypothetical protein
MVARLKLKEIDGRAPPGVKAVSAPYSSALWWSVLAGIASCPSGSDIPKLRETPNLQNMLLLSGP